MSRPGAWEKGQTGNPKGRPARGKTLSDRLRKLLSKKMDGKDITYRDAILFALLKAAADGSLGAAAMVFERIEGKVADNHNVNFTNSPEWVEMRTLIVNILRPHPEALQELGEALAEQERKLLGDKSP